MGYDLNTYLASIGDKCSDERLISLTVEGELAERLGFTQYDVYGRTPSDIANFLKVNFKWLPQFLREEESKGVHYVYFVDGRVASLEELHYGIGSHVRIVPVIPGSGGTFGTIAKIALGAGLIAASFFIPGSAVIAIGAAQIALSSVALTLGVALALGGLSSLLTPKQTSGKQKQSTSFGGTISRTQQGRAIPIPIGESYIDLSQYGIVLSAGVDVSKAPIDNSSSKGASGK